MPYQNLVAQYPASLGLMTMLVSEEDSLNQAIQMLSASLAASNRPKKKPVLLHCLRIGFYLSMQKCSRDAVLAGFLHDLLEDTDCEESKNCGSLRPACPGAR